MQEEHKSSSTSSSNRLWLIISAIIAITVIAVLMVPETKKQADDIPLPVGLQKNQPEAAITAAAAENQDAKPPQQIPIDEIEPPALAGGVAARAFLAESAQANLQPNDVYHQAQLFQSEGKLADAWLLYFKAAKEGQVDAALMLAEQADPKYFKAEASMLSRPDVVQAHKWYVLAQQNGSELAARRLKMLLAGLERSARAGDEQAAVLLNKWK